ncbi:GvpL/GvpF family gas vesicle protein [Streptomyces sp. N2-109]|uniref:GvpL/GvpF family gas vesicle protein n=1 Tax=Streptomyces gossypii TaxID=2883101 RepID=A0ABT2K3K3_9ACTN|nr:GvpL/GvpF family gas vesicle protein [Streptomyces gossypii]MCT2594762.1 GvpL/GvpF family gas vesicle protein [Streptomyces gossypii]
MKHTDSGSAAAPESGQADATYVFAVCGRGCDPAALAGLSGQAAGTPVRLLPFGSLEAVVQDVPARAFGEETLRERLSDRAELEQCARAHHAVIAAAADTAPTLPLPLATLYRGDERARAALRADEGRFLAVLERIADRVEWGIKVYAGRRRPSTPAPPHQASRPRTPGGRESRAVGSASRPGHAYLERVRGARDEREQRQEAGLAAADAVDRALRKVAVAGRRLRSHDPALNPEHGVQLLNAAYLVDQERAAELMGAIEQLRRSPEHRGIELEVTGPWVPYSFVEGGDPVAGR